MLTSWHLVSASQRLSSGLSSCVRMCHVCYTDSHVSLNIIEKFIPKPKIFTETRTQDSFRVCDLSSCNLLSETNKFCLGNVLLLWLVLELHKTSSLGLEPRRDFGVVAFVSIISSPKRTNFTLAPFFCRAYYPSYRNHLHWESNSGKFFGVRVSVFSPSKQKFWSRRHSSVMLSLRTTGNALSGNQTQDTFLRSFDPRVISSWSQEISIPYLLQIGLSVLDL
jgi:hypothetical protein